ncbi:MAG TPA: hypothetical protein VOA41_08015 [Candidatus Dormibacteraeota bacterium]|nr:hypothetical protein [Candidatus Dormibacteraeota bacterium]
MKSILLRATLSALALVFFDVLSHPFFGNDLCAQSSSNGNSAERPSGESLAPQTAAAQGAANKKTKKVWTNEDVSGLTGSVSVVGNPAVRHPIKGEASERLDQQAQETRKSGDDIKDAEWYRQRLAPLRSQLEYVERQIQKLKNFRASNAAPDGGMQHGSRYNMTPLAEQVKQLEVHKKSLQSKFDDLESDARHHGIEPGELR